MERYIGAAHLQGAYRVMSQDRSKLYLTRTDELQPDLLPGRQGGLGYYSNIGTLGGWLTESPYVLERNGAYGITNPFRDAVNSEVLRIVSNDIGPVLRYIRAHYAPNAEAVEEDVINGEYTVWRIVEETSKA